MSPVPPGKVRGCRLYIVSGQLVCTISYSFLTVIIDLPALIYTNLTITVVVAAGSWQWIWTLWSWAPSVCTRHLPTLASTFLTLVIWICELLSIQKGILIVYAVWEIWPTSLHGRSTYRVLKRNKYNWQHGIFLLTSKIDVLPGHVAQQCPGFFSGLEHDTDGHTMGVHWTVPSYTQVRVLDISIFYNLPYTLRIIHNNISL